MAAAEAANKTSQAAAAVASDSNDNAIHPPAKKLIDPQLLMAARRGYSKRIKELLRLNTEEVESHGNTGSNGGGGGVVESAAASAGAVILEVAPDGPAAAPATPPPLVDGDGVTIEGEDTLLHVVAACGDGDDFIDCAKMIVRDKKRKGGAYAVRLALEARNREGDTPLHCAAGAGNASMICCLVDLIASETTDDEAAGAEAKKALVRTQNECGETALHQAIRAARNKEACIDQLMGVDPELACIPHEDGASPLYLGISLGEIEIAEHLYVKSNGKLSYSGPDGRNVLHAAIPRAHQALPMILDWLYGMQKEAAAVKGQGERGLLSQLTNQRDKQQQGSTPLHLAVTMDCWPGASVPRATAESVATALLNANESTAYQADDEGCYPIHLAAAVGSLDVVKVLLERCPDCATLRGGIGKGQTFLHVAAANTSTVSGGVVKYVCERMPHHLASMILNAQDSRGDTALHLAVRDRNVQALNCLVRNQQVRLDVANKDGMTPRDVSLSVMAPSGKVWLWNAGARIWLTLLLAQAPYSGCRPDLFVEKHITQPDEGKESAKYTAISQSTSVIAVLIATVTFASAFTLPGGYRGADGGDAAGTPLLAGSYAFDAFVLADTLAFLCSCLAAVILSYAGMPLMDSFIRYRYFIIAMVFLQSAVRSFVAAFALGLYLVLAPVDHNVAVAVCVIVSASSLYGNMVPWQRARLANTVRGRVGIRPSVVWRNAVVNVTLNTLVHVSVHFGSYIIIFGLPAIRKR